jgi:hypothetical protein
MQSSKIQRPALQLDEEEKKWAGFLRVKVIEESQSEALMTAKL